MSYLTDVTVGVNVTYYISQNLVSKLLFWTLTIFTMIHTSWKEDNLSLIPPSPCQQFASLFQVLAEFVSQVPIFRALCILVRWRWGIYRSGTVNSNTVNSKFHLIPSYCEIFVYNCPNILCLKYTVNSNFHLLWSKTLPMNDFELTVPELYMPPPSANKALKPRGDITRSPKEGYHFLLISTAGQRAGEPLLLTSSIMDVYEGFLRSVGEWVLFLRRVSLRRSSVKRTYVPTGERD